MQTRIHNEVIEPHRVGAPGRSFGSFHVLGVRVDVVQVSDVVGTMQRWIVARNSCRYIAVTGMHGVTEAQNDPEFKDMLNAADLVVPDGMPLVWLGRHHGHAMRRVCGADLMVSFCAHTAKYGYRHFFYGGNRGVADELAQTLAKRFRGLHVAGTYCPPFRPLTEEEDRDVVARIERSHADIVWVGLSTPKQERWMFAHRARLDVPLLIGVGAAFDFHTGRVARAPAWMGEHGLEWLFRLSREPRRLWRRYLLGGSQFLFCVSLELLGLRRFE